MTKTKPKGKAPLLTHHRHTGKALPRQHTSYALVAFLMLITGVFMLSISWRVHAEMLTVQATVDGPLPPSVATISSPANLQRFTGRHIPVSGSCPAGYMVKLYRNNDFAGAVLCGAGDTFALSLDLVAGKNVLEAKIFNGADKQGPSSSPITVYYDVPTSAESLRPGAPAPVPELLLRSDNLYRGYYPGDTVNWVVELTGGQAPYAVNVDWGDGTNDVISRSVTGKFELKHVYKQQGEYRGSYTITVKASDAGGQKAQLQLVVIISDPQGSTTVPDANTVQLTGVFQSLRARLFIAWPIYLTTLLMLISFWLGERREAYVLKKQFAKH